MILNEMFNRGSIEEIRNTVNNLEVIGCVDKFVSYLERYENDRNNEIDKFEKEYMRRLDRHISELVCNIYMEDHLNKSNEELLETIRKMYIDGVYEIDENISNNGLRDVFYYKDADAYKYIKAYMIKALDKYVEELNLTAVEERIKKLEISIDSSKIALERNAEYLDRDVKLLKELKGYK